MTPGKVVDASAIAAIVFDEKTKEATIARLRGAALYAPKLLPFEVASVALKKIRDRPVERQPLIAAYAKLRRLAISYEDVDLDIAIGLAELSGLTLYDASYLWLAQKLGMELVTLDKRLGNAASRRPSA